MKLGIAKFHGNIQLLLLKSKAETFIFLKSGNRLIKAI